MSSVTPPFSRFSSIPEASGLYDPRHEKDACGLAMVATLRGSAGHDIIATALGALRNLEHRGAVGSDAGTGDGAGHRHPDPGRVPPRGGRTSSCPAAGAMRSAWPSCPTTRPSATRSRPASRRLAAEESLTVLGWREVPVEPGVIGKPRARGDARLRAAVHRIHADRRQGRARRRPCPRAPGVPAAQARRARPARVLPVAVVPHAGLQGHGDHAPARAVLPRPVGRAVRVAAGARPLALLDEHLPVVAARAAVPAHLAQRRDQHHRGQPQLDARAPVTARVLGAGRPAAAVPDQHPRCERLRVVRRGGRAAEPRRPVAAARDDDDGPRGVREPGRPRPGAPRVLRVPLDDHGAVGRPGRSRLHRRHAGRRHARPQRAAPRALPRHRRRSGRAGERDRRAAGCRPEQGRAQGTAPPRPDVPGRHRRGPHHRGRRDQGRARRIRALGAVARARARSRSRTCPTASTSCTPPHRCRAASARSATPRRRCASS